MVLSIGPKLELAGQMAWLVVGGAEIHCIAVSQEFGEWSLVTVSDGQLIELVISVECYSSLNVTRSEGQGYIAVFEEVAMELFESLVKVSG